MDSKTGEIISTTPGNRLPKRFIRITETERILLESYPPSERPQKLKELRARTESDLERLQVANAKRERKRLARLKQ